MLDRLQSWLKHDGGVAAIEFGLVTALMAVAAISGITSFGHKLGGPDISAENNLR